jgi:aspartyl-tRNA(Asn)/glutamyl-tRNA(Gln) amidotransferase subunit C
MLSLKTMTELADLARIELTEPEMVSFLDAFEKIIQLAHEAQQVNTDVIEPIAHCLNVPQRLRSDSITESNQVQKFQALTQEAHAGLYFVPPVIETSTAEE